MSVWGGDEKHSGQMIIRERVDTWINPGSRAKENQHLLSMALQCAVHELRPWPCSLVSSSFLSAVTWTQQVQPASSPHRRALEVLVFLLTELWNLVLALCPAEPSASGVLADVTMASLMLLQKCDKLPVAQCSSLMKFTIMVTASITW